MQSAAGQRFQRPQANVAEVPDRGGDQIEPGRGGPGLDGRAEWRVDARPAAGSIVFAVFAADVLDHAAL